MTALIPTRIDTSRLVLRTWRPEDRAAMVEINADPEVVRFVAREPVTRERSDALLDRIERSWADRGYGLYALESLGSGDLLGFCGLSHHRALPDEVEVGWRLARSAWGQGFATEAALVCRDLAFDVLGRERLISITVEENQRSWRVMEKLGMRRWRTMPFEEWDLSVWAMTADERQVGGLRG
ncbi:MAG TPA: GNAT family N-acetyltransferase [Jiangellaceae bacterium]|nr:GNAT family N-acetyltransferase [Jiangellaceae bacterium]